MIGFKSFGCWENLSDGGQSPQNEGQRVSSCRQTCFFLRFRWGFRISPVILNRDMKYIDGESAHLPTLPKNGSPKIHGEILKFQRIQPNLVTWNTAVAVGHWKLTLLLFKHGQSKDRIPENPAKRDRNYTRKTWYETMVDFEIYMVDLWVFWTCRIANGCDKSKKLNFKNVYLLVLGDIGFNAFFVYAK